MCSYWLDISYLNKGEQQAWPGAHGDIWTVGTQTWGERLVLFGRFSWSIGFGGLVGFQQGAKGHKEGRSGTQ